MNLALPLRKPPLVASSLLFVAVEIEKWLKWRGQKTTFPRPRGWTFSMVMDIIPNYSYLFI
jgi:hypothetical protein